VPLHRGLSGRAVILLLASLCALIGRIPVAVAMPRIVLEPALANLDEPVYVTHARDSTIALEAPMSLIQWQALTRP
jgi:hypothetical protein